MVSIVNGKNKQMSYRTDLLIVNHCNLHVDVPQHSTWSFAKWLCLVKKVYIYQNVNPKNIKIVQNSSGRLASHT